MSGRPDIIPDVWRVADFADRHRTPAEAINAAIQACQYDSGRLGGIVALQPDTEYPIDQPLIMNIPGVTIRAPGSPAVVSVTPYPCLLQSEYDGPIFEVPDHSPYKLGGLHFEGIQLRGGGNSAWENQVGVLVNTSDAYRSWFTFARCSIAGFDKAVEVCNSTGQPWKAIGHLHFRECNITWNSQGIVGTGGARVHGLSVRDSAFRQANRSCQHPFANHINGACHTWDNVVLEMSGNAILYDTNSSQLSFHNLWMEDMRGDYGVRCVGCHDIDIGYQRRYERDLPMERSIQLHKCGRYHALCDVCVTGGGNV